MKNLHLILTCAAGITFFGCGSDSSTEGDHKSDLTSLEQAAEEAVKEETANKDQEIIDEILSSFPSPLEMAIIIESSGAPFSEKYLNNPDHIESYATSTKKALNLGIYGTDLGYINLYEQNSATLTYLGAVKNLADDLKIGQFFDIPTLAKLAESKDNMPELINISQTSFNDLNKYLKDQNRSSVSTSILIGGWIEALYLATIVAQADGDSHNELLERIGDQKIILEDISSLVKAFEPNKEFKQLESGLKNLESAYQNVSVTYTQIGESDAEPEMELDENGMLIVASTTESKVNITEEDLVAIASSVEDLRTKLIQ